ncbi:MAG: FGGY family carbohydrate kinase [Nitrososphaeria archaeon]|nr:FGGY family carbohydrate kinase [Nitrososphaeria archaeon]
MGMHNHDCKDEYVIGVDIGTSSAKVCLFDISGNTVSETHVEYQVLTPRPGWREQKAEWWWEATIKLLRGLAERAKLLNRKNLKGIAVTHQRLTFVPVNERIEPIHNAILWNDVRCSEEVEYARRTIGENEIFNRTGVAPGYWSIYKILWIKNNLPEVYAKTHKFVLVPDFICFKLTGKLVTTQSAAILTGALDIRSPNRWCSDIVRALGIDEEKLVDEILPSGVIIGELTEEVAKTTSLPSGVPIVTAAGDQPCGTLGAGLKREGQVAVNGGTSCTSEILSKALPRLDDPRNYYLEISPIGKYILETTIPSGGSDLMKWFRENFGYKLVEEAISKNMDVWTHIYNQPKNSQIGSLGVLLVPYFNSAGPPYWDLDTGGVILGLTTDTKYYHFIRAIMEGLAFEVKRHIKMLERGADIKIDELLMYGGSSRSDVWNQIFSDVIGIKVVVPKTPETTSLGAAICAAVGGGVHKSFEDAIVNMVHIEKTYSPNSEANKIYEELFERCYLPIYENVRDIVLESRRILKKYEK